MSNLLSNVKDKITDVLNSDEVSGAIYDTKNAVDNIVLKVSAFTKDSINKVADGINSIDPSMNLKWGEPYNLTYYEKLYNMVFKFGMNVDKQTFIQKVKDVYSDTLKLKDTSKDEVDLCKVILSSCNINTSIENMNAMLSSIIKLRKEIKSKSIPDNTLSPSQHNVEDENIRGEILETLTSESSQRQDVSNEDDSLTIVNNQKQESEIDANKEGYDSLLKLYDDIDKVNNSGGPDKGNDNLDDKDNNHTSLLDEDDDDDELSDFTDDFTSNTNIKLSEDQADMSIDSFFDSMNS